MKHKQKPTLQLNYNFLSCTNYVHEGLNARNLLASIKQKAFSHFKTLFTENIKPIAEN